MNPIQSTPLSAVTSPQFAAAPAAGPGRQSSFREFMLEASDHASSTQQHASRSVAQLMGGDEVNPAEVLTAVQKAELSFQMTMQIHNTLLRAYQEIKEIRV